MRLHPGVCPLELLNLIIFSPVFSIRTATSDDIDILVDIESKSFPAAEMATRESFAARLAVFPDDFLLLFKDGVPVGLIDGMCTDQPTISDDMFENAALHKPNGRYQSVFGLAVSPDFRGQGCASALMRAFIEKARQEGRDGVILTCKEHLIGFYERFGFREMGVSQSVHGGAVWHDMTLLFPKQATAGR